MAVYGKNTAQGKWKPRNPEKYAGKVEEIYYRSSWEVKFFNWLDLNPDVISWCSEEVVVPYFDPVQNKMRRYFVDFWAKVKTASGVKKFLIEIKPDKFTKPPEQPKKKTKRYIEEAMQYATNCAKWEAANRVCKDNNMQFLILTETHLFGKK